MAETPRCRRACPVCGREEARPLYRNSMAPLDGLDMSYQVSTCPGCGFAYASELPCPAVYADYYRTLSKYDLLGTAAEVRPVDRLRMQAAIEICRPHLDPDAVILDIGCGTGALLRAFADAGWGRVLGFDPAPHAAEKARLCFGLNSVCSGGIQQAADYLSGLNPQQSVSLVCLMGVLEHLPDLRRDLTYLTSQLGSKTRILIEVPAIDRCLRKFVEPYGEFSLEHIQYFDSHSLVRLMTSFGYRSVASSIIDLPYGTSDSLMALFERGVADIGAIDPSAGEDGGRFDLQPYIDCSERAMKSLEDRYIACKATKIVLYGAGSHTARLLARPACQQAVISAVVDGNPNLQGKYIGSHVIQTPDYLIGQSDATVVVSSSSSSQAIADYVIRRFGNPIYLLYPIE